MRKISLCIPTFNRVEMLFEAFEKVYDDNRIAEIVIVDDSSEHEVWERVMGKCYHLPKVKLYRNLENRDCYWNKYTVMSFATQAYCILFDSDNIIDKDYIDKIYEHEWSHDLILAPSYAMPHFDYRAYEGLEITKYNVAEYMDKPLFATALNTCNCFINRNEYLRIWDGTVDPVTADSIFLNYCWLNAGNRILIVPGLSYFHMVHDGSHYVQNNYRTGYFYDDVEQKLKSMI